MKGQLRKLVSTNRELSLVLALIAASLLLFLLPPALKYPLARDLNIVTLAPFQGVSERIQELGRTSEENRGLRRQLLECELDVIFSREALRQNQRLRDSLGFLDRLRYKLVPAELVGTDPRRKGNAVISSFRNLGQVGPDLAVVNLQGLVGKTTSVMGDRLTIELLTSPNCRVAARDQNTRTLGIIKWEWGLTLLFDNVSIRDKVAVGDTVVSSGLGGVFPPGLPIGTISDITIPERGFFARILVEPFVRFSTLDEVFVLKMAGN